MADRHTELEFKFDARRVNPEHFVATMTALNPSSYETQGQFDDDYYVRTVDGLILRHRLLGGAGELTYKRRRSADDLTDRLEINLNFHWNTEVGDVQGFLLQTGHEKLMTVRKTFAHVFHFVRPDYKVEVALYGAGILEGWVKDAERRFLEIEVVGPTMPLEARQVILEDWRALVRHHVPLGPQLNESLYEIYSKQVQPNTNYHI